MKRNPYLPADDTGKMVWLNNFAAKIATYAATVGLNPGEVSNIAADAAHFAFYVESVNAYRAWLQQLTAQKNLLRDGPPGTGPVVFTPPPTVTPPNGNVLPGLIERIGKYVQRIKNYPTFTDAIGEDLGIIGAESTFDPGALKPILKSEFQAGHPNILWTKGHADALELQVDRTGNGTFVPLAIDTEPDYLDTASLPSGGGSGVWKYRGIYRLNDEQIGSWSDTLAVAVLGM